MIIHHLLLYFSVWNCVCRWFIMFDLSSQSYSFLFTGGQFCLRATSFPNFHFIPSTASFTFNLLSKNWEKDLGQLISFAQNIGSNEPHAADYSDPCRASAGLNLDILLFHYVLLLLATSSSSTYWFLHSLYCIVWWMETGQRDTR